MTAPDWFAIIDATWPAATTHKMNGWTVREGRGGGKRVSAISGSGNISTAENAQRTLGQSLLFMIKEGQTDLDSELDARGYHIIDPVVVMAKALPKPGHGVGPSDPSAAAVRIWDAGGIGPARRAVMARAKGPKTIVEQKGGCGFVACHQNIAMIHALEVSLSKRRQGIGTALEQAACAWAPARKIAALTLEENKASRALFSKAGYCVVTRYHYRIKP